MSLDTTIAKIIEAVPYIVFLVAWIYSERARADYLLQQLILSKNAHIESLENRENRHTPPEPPTP